MSNGKMTDTAKKLLGDNQPSYIWGDLGFRDGEYDGISTERMFEFLDAYPIFHSVVDHNSYGEFQFITVKAIQYANDGTPMETGITFWGNGYHKFRETTLTGWQMSVQTFLYRDHAEIKGKDTVKNSVMVRRETMDIPETQQKSGNSFETLADLSDDDYALFNDIGEF